MTSPPYWGLRDYRVDSQLGLERTPGEYVANLVAVFAEVRRVLREDGTLWLNLGDSYAGSWGAQGHRESPAAVSRGQIRNHPKRASHTGTIREAGLKPKDLVGIPWMVAFALRADGWYLRSDVIWAKPNPMPESVGDRPTKAHEYLFLLSKRPRYFYDAEAIRENAIHEGRIVKATGAGSRNGQVGDGVNDRRLVKGFTERDTVVSGRNKRSVWEVSTRPFPEAHFATFPPQLVEPCILAGSPPICCGDCAAPWSRVVERELQDTEGWGAAKKNRHQGVCSPDAMTRNGTGRAGTSVVRTLGWQPACDHANDAGRAVVLDPFAGAGTTGLVAAQLGRDFLGIELNPEYAEIARRRIRRWEANPTGSLTGDPEPIAGQLGLDLETNERRESE